MRNLLRNALLLLGFMFLIGAEQQPKAKSPAQQKALTDDRFVFQRLPNGVEHWAVKSQAPNALPAFFQIIENLANVIFGDDKLPFRRTVVFLVGVPEYARLTPSLPFVANDLEDLRAYFLNQGGADEVYVVKGSVATASLVNNYMGHLFRYTLQPDDRLVFYFAGHGTEGGTTGYMQFYNAVPDNLVTDVLKISDVREWSRNIPARHVLFLIDSCYSGLGVTSRATLGDQRKQVISTLSRNGSRTIITAGFGNQKTYETASKGGGGNGVFTRSLLQSLTSGSGEGFLTINEVFANLERRVASWATTNNVKVSPKRWALDEEEFPGTFIFVNPNSVALKKSLDEYRPYLDARARSAESQENIDLTDVVRAQNLREQGVLAFQRGNLAEASGLLGKALDERIRISPISLPVAESLSDLGKLALDEGSLDRAENYFRESIEIARKLAPEGYHTAEALNGIGSLALKRGDLDNAESFFKEALEIASRMPRSLLFAETLQNLGRVALRKGNLHDAEKYLGRALSIVEEQAPKSRLETSLHQDAFVLFRELNKIELIPHEAEAAVASFESEFSRVGGTLVDKAMFRSRQHEFASTYIWFLAEQRRFSSALSLLDGLQSRILAERIMEGAGYIPQSALRNPAPRPFLEPTTALIAFKVREDGVLILVDALEGTSATFVPCERIRLQFLVGRVSESLKNGGSRSVTRRGVGSNPIGHRISIEAKELYDILIGPVEDRIEDSERLAIITDGPLDLLAFPALVRRLAKTPEGRNQYFVEWKPHFKIPSYSVLRQMRERRASNETHPISLLAMGPGYFCTRARAADSLQMRGRLEFPPLPWADAEVKEISKFFPEGRLYLGKLATKEAFLKYAPDSRYIHIGAHSIADSVDPLKSLLAFTVTDCERPEEDFLYAAEIAEKLDVRADLVTLASCESGLGISVPAEGVMGLAWAFLAAGARSVVASMWSVEDKATRDLMVDFYSRLRVGESKLEALRRAQINMIQSKAFSSPYYWAGFELYGDWK